MSANGRKGGKEENKSVRKVRGIELSQPLAETRTAEDGVTDESVRKEGGHSGVITEILIIYCCEP